MPAQQDLTTDPALQDSLRTARSGTAFFGQKLDELSDVELDAPSSLPGWSRRHVVAHVSYNAQAIARLMNWANTGVETAMYESVEARNREIEHGVSLDADALRSLFERTAADLDAVWRDTPQAAWERPVKTANGATVQASETVWMRTRETWMHAVDLGDGATFSDLPGAFNERLLKHITGVWKKRGDGTELVLRASPDASTADFGDLGASDPEIVFGSLADIAAWSCGRGSLGVSSNRGQLPAPPHWQ